MLVLRTIFGLKLLVCQSEFCIESVLEGFVGGGLVLMRDVSCLQIRCCGLNMGLTLIFSFLWSLLSFSPQSRPLIDQGCD